MHTIAGTPCRATRVATDFLDFIAFCRCSSGVALHPLKILVSHLFTPPPPFPGGVAPKFGSEKVSRCGVAGTVAGVALHCATKPGTVLQIRCANARPFLWNEMGPLQVTSGKFQAIRGPLSGNFRQFSGDFRQLEAPFQATLGNLGAHRARKKTS